MIVEQRTLSSRWQRSVNRTVNPTQGLIADQAVVELVVSQAFLNTSTSRGGAGLPLKSSAASLH